MNELDALVTAKQPPILEILSAHWAELFTLAVLVRSLVLSKYVIAMEGRFHCYFQRTRSSSRESLSC